MGPDRQSEWGKLNMTMYVYGTDGDAVGFLFENFIYDMAGTPLGRIIGSRVHRFDGQYVGEWFKETVVERPTARPRMMPPVPVPSRRPSPGATARRRAVVDYGYHDAFHLLYDGAAANDAGGAFRQAAE